MTQQYRFRQWINNQLELKGWRMSDFADEAGIGRSAVSRWVNEGYQPSIPNARAAAAVLGVSLLEILVESGQLSEDEATGYKKPPRKREVQGRAFRAKMLADVSGEELAAEVTRRLTATQRR